METKVKESVAHKVYLYSSNMRIIRMNFKILISLIYFLTMTSVSIGQDLSELVNYVRGAKIIAQDDENTYLGKLSNEFDSESIFNEFGTYGSEFASTSIWNEFSTFGNEFNSYSPFNEFSSNPPMLIKDGKIIAYLTVNKTIKGAVSPNILKALKDEF